MQSAIDKILNKKGGAEYIVATVGTAASIVILFLVAPPAATLVGAVGKGIACAGGICASNTIIPRATNKLMKPIRQNSPEVQNLTKQIQTLNSEIKNLQAEANKQKM